jgi:hypothetical protein
MDNLFTLIAIIIVVVSVVRKIKAQQKSPSGATAPGGGWITKLNAFLADIQRKMEQQPSGRATGASGWDQLLDGGSQANSLEDLEFEEEEIPPSPPPMPIVTPSRAYKNRSDNQQIIPAGPRRSARCSEKQPLLRVARNRAALRKAVVWSEILGPPVALKNSRSGGR